MFDLSALEHAIERRLRYAVTDLLNADSSLRFVSCGLVEDLTGFFVAGASTTWLSSLKTKKQGLAWEPSEWPLEAKEDETSDTDVTNEIWELSGTQAMIDGTGDELAEDEYDELRIQYQNLIVKTLGTLKDEGLLRNQVGQEIWVWCHSADASNEELDLETFSVLQSNELSELFAQRFSGNGRELIDLALRSA